MILTLFLQGTSPPVNPPEPTAFFLHAELRSKYTDYFITGFLICHSFLDFLYIGVLHRSRRNSLSGSKQYPLPDFIQ